MRTEPQDGGGKDDPFAVGGDKLLERAKRIARSINERIKILIERAKQNSDEAKNSDGTSH